MRPEIVIDSVTADPTYIHDAAGNPVLHGYAVTVGVQVTGVGSYGDAVALVERRLRWPAPELPESV